MGKAAEARFWDRFIQLARQHEVPGNALRWYVRRVECYVQAHPDKPLRTHEASDVTDYLQRTGRSGALRGWQFRQVVHALQLLFTELVRADWADAFEWRYWLESSRELEADHPTVARHNSPPEPNAPAQPASVGEVPYTDLIRDLVSEIRRRNYSIRTEQAYLQWVRRFVLYHGDRDPRDMGGEEVAAYLNHLLGLPRHAEPGAERDGVSLPAGAGQGTRHASRAGAPAETPPCPDRAHAR